MMRRIGLLFFVGAAASAARADEVVLRNGAVFSGVVREEGDRVVVEIDAGTMTFRRADVREIRRTEDPLQEFERRLRAAADAEAYYELALWARERGLTSRAQELFRKVIALEPDHEGARKALGHEKVEGRWMEPDEAMVARGFVKVDGRWLKRETAEMLLAQERLHRIEVERRQSEERLARLRKEVEMAWVAVERERIELERERGLRPVLFPGLGILPVCPRPVRPGPQVHAPAPVVPPPPVAIDWNRARRDAFGRNGIFGGVAKDPAPGGAGKRSEEEPCSVIRR